MMATAIVILAVLAAGPLDRLRGHPFHVLDSRLLDKVLYASALALACGATDPLVLIALAAAMVAGMSPGWGEPMAAIFGGRAMRPDHLEWWQLGPARERPMWALALRGALWGAPAVPVALLGAPLALVLLYPLAFAIAMPAAMAARRWTVLGRDPWGRVELARGWLAALMIALAGAAIL
ncbi:MAG: hypothetical protein ACK4KV_19070 [Rhodocyclaceae bacterium]